MKKKYLITTFLLITFFSFPSPIFAQQKGSADIKDAGVIGSNPPAGVIGTNPAAGKTQTISYLQNPLQANNVKDLLYSIVDLAIFIGIIFAVLMFVFIGFKFVLAQGNDTALKEARKWFLYTVVGTAILISSKVIVEVIKSTFISAGVVNKELFK